MARIKKSIEDMMVVTLSSDDIDNDKINQIKGKLQKALGKNKGIVFGISSNDRVEVSTFVQNKKEFVVVTIASDTITDEMVESLETEFKNRLGNSSVAVFSIFPTERLDFQSLQSSRTLQGE